MAQTSEGVNAPSPGNPLFNGHCPRAMVELFWGEETPFRQILPDFESRPQQREMALNVAESLEAGEHAMIEAPTGIGKSFAYLVPAITHALRLQKPVVITTHTIALQEQLINKDIPLLSRAFPERFKAALGKGRPNYLCQIRLNNLAKEAGDFLPSMDLAPELSRIINWSKHTEDGSLSDLDFQPTYSLWSSINAAPDICTGPEHEYCFANQARRQLYKANIIVVNHALFCIDLARRMNKEDPILPNYSAVIIDEAHTFENTASNHLGIRLSSFDLMLTTARLLNTRTGKGLISRFSATICEAIKDLQDRANLFFGRIRSWMDDIEESPVPYIHPNFLPNELSQPLRHFCDLLMEEIHSLPVPEPKSAEEKRLDEILSCVKQLRAFADNFEIFIEMALPDHVYWIERFGRNNNYLSFHVIPIEVRNILRKHLFNKDFSVILTSATLAVRRDLSYACERLGLDECRRVILDTPFDYANNVQLFLPPPDMPDPRNEDEYVPYAMEAIRKFIRQTDGRAFVLFTSVRMMNLMGEMLADFFESLDINLMIQGRDMPRSKMLEVFRRDVRSVIFGTDSFWMGVDVPGESLSNVILTKLPFPVPSHPWVHALCEVLRKQGKNPFFDYSLPEAILKFRQGFG
ncbi:MAG: DEAD/DEAH box helicase, partial [Lentisphaerae bacterium]